MILGGDIDAVVLGAYVVAVDLTLGNVILLGILFVNVILLGIEAIVFGIAEGGTTDSRGTEILVGDSPDGGTTIVREGSRLTTGLIG